jgi:type II secretory pathway predicted ATPase ExeA
MDWSQFGLKFRPFGTGPDPAGYFPAPDHEDTLAALTQALGDLEPYVVLTGEPGLGKTLLAHLAVKQLGDDVAVAFVTNCHFERRADLLQAILHDFGQPYAGRPEQELRLALTDFVLQYHIDGRRTLVVLDEAQTLTADMLEEVRLLGNLETPAGRAVQVLLVGQPELLEALARPESAVLSQRLCTRLAAMPFGLRDSAEYIAFQVSRAGGDPASIMTDEAMEVLARGCRGVPRLLNQAAAATLKLAARAEQDTADAETATEALAGLPHAGLPAGDEPLFAPIIAARDETDEPAETWAEPQRFVFAPAPTP